MPCPFPGMDPYLEDSPFWQGFHNRFMTYLCDTLQPLLPEPYVATLEVRIVLERGSSPPGAAERIPDVEAVQVTPERGGVATLPRTAARAPAPGYWIEDAAIETREALIHVLRLPKQSLITSLELLSPSNKRSGPGRTQYLAKQRQMLEAGVNLVEIDLLRAGRHTVAVSEARLQVLPNYHYLICTWNASRPEGFHVQPCTMRDPLPEISVPLHPQVGPLQVDLQALFTHTFGAGRLDRLLSPLYAKPLRPRPAPGEGKWIQECLAAAGKSGL